MPISVQLKTRQLSILLIQGKTKIVMHQNVHDVPNGALA